MAGTIAGGKQASKSNKERYGEDFYKRIGSIGGKRGTTGGFAKNIVCSCNLIEEDHLIKQCAGRRGGRISRRIKQCV